MSYDVIILGAGGAGMMCAIEASKRGRKTLLIDHAAKIGGKILISGGGRCNFTNYGAGPSNYVSNNPHFCKSALSRFTPSDFIEMVNRHQIQFHEKKLGQLFCDDSARQIVQMLEDECKEAGVEIQLDCKVDRVSKESDIFKIESSKGKFESESLVVATGGLSIPKIGASGIGYEIAKQFNLKLVERAPALDGFVFDKETTQEFSSLSGVSIDVTLSVNGKNFRENILFTHSGMSGPAALQGSLHWYSGDLIELDLLPENDLFDWIKEKKSSGNKSQIKNLISERMPSRLAEYLCFKYFKNTLPLPQLSEKDLKVFCDKIHAWKLKPMATVGYSKAEVTRGGVDTDELSSKTMETKSVKGLYFIGEVVDVTGWLGGYNFQWAWASGWSAGQVV